jgi:hypothetical protein
MRSDTPGASDRGAPELEPFPTVRAVASDRSVVTDHELLEITCPPGTGCRACCSCGWESDFQPSAGLAGALWDAHAATES